LFALSGAAGGKFVGASLQHEDGVDECIVIHVQQLDNFSFGFSDAIAADRFELMRLGVKTL
jgi:hypothetical protein